MRRCSACSARFRIGRQRLIFFAASRGGLGGPVHRTQARFIGSAMRFEPCAREARNSLWMAQVGWLFCFILAHPSMCNYWIHRKTSGESRGQRDLFTPALGLLNEHCRNRRNTPELSDECFLCEGLLRVLGQWDSGCDFSQACQDEVEELARATWFGALHSGRRAALVAEVATRSCYRFDQYHMPPDWLVEFPELTGREAWAVDGHQIDHACHAARDSKGELVSGGEIYGLCLHSGLQRALAPFQGTASAATSGRVSSNTCPAGLPATAGRNC